MKTHIILAILAAFFVVEYEGYNWQPCSDGVCYAINCPLGGCYQEGSRDICPDEKCVIKILEKRGEDHLRGIWKVLWLGEKNHTIERMKPVKTYSITLEGESKALQYLPHLTGENVLKMDED